MKYLYKFLRAGLKSEHDGSEWTVGEWRTVPAPTQECVGLNASEYIQQALSYVRQPVLAKVECGGKIIKGDDKWTCEKMRIVAVADWTSEHSLKMAIFSARSCLDKFENKYPGNDKPRKAIEAAEAVLANDTAKNRKAARIAADAAYAAYAAYAAADAADADAYADAYTAYAADDAAAAAYADDVAAADDAKRSIHYYCLSIVTWRTME